MKKQQNILFLFAILLGWCVSHTQQATLVAAEQLPQQESVRTDVQSLPKEESVKVEPINPETLPIHNFFLFAQEKYKQKVPRAAALFSYDVQMLKDISNDFNTVHAAKHPFLAKRFVKAYTSLQDVDFNDLDPHHLRDQSDEVEAFDAYVERYLARKRHSLSQDETIFLHRLLFFNQRTMLNLAQNFSLEFDLERIVGDWLLYKPLWFVQKHPYWTALIVFLILVVIAFIAYKIYLVEKDEKREKEDQRSDARHEQDGALIHQTTEGGAAGKARG